jgi:DNA-binding beta-propeller fold protein YncE
MRTAHYGAAATLATLVGIGVIGGSTSAHQSDDGSVSGTIWVANRDTHEIKGFDAATGDVVRTVAMAANSAPGDHAYANGKLYVAEEMGTAPAIAVIDHEDHNQVVGAIGYPGQPHGIVLAPQ